jgi:hypothetical protein
VIAGWALVLAARAMRLPEMPVVTLTGLSAGQARMLRLALNRLYEDSRWNRDALRSEIAQILEIENDVEIDVSGFETAEIDSLTLDDGSDEEDELEPLYIRSALSSPPSFRICTRTSELVGRGSSGTTRDK